MTKKNPKAYTATHDVYVSHTYFKAGEPFVTDADKEDTWTELSPEEASIDKGSLEKVPGDVPLEGMSTAALQALAATKNVNSTGMSKKQLIDAVKAANEPAL